MFNLESEVELANFKYNNYSIAKIYLFYILILSIIITLILII